MESPQLDLDRAIPDRTRTDNLPTPLAAEVDFLAGRTGPWLDADQRASDAMRACAHVIEGSTSEAIILLEGLDLEAVSPQELVSVAWSASRVDVPNLHEAVLERIDMCGQGFLMHEGVPVCTVSMLRGLMAIATGNLDEAAAWLRLSVTEGDTRAPFWGALARVELARVQLTMSSAPTPRARYDIGDARRNLGAARTFFTSAGYTHLGRVAKSLLRLCDDPQPVAVGPPADDRSSDLPAAAPLLGIMHKETADPADRSNPIWHVGFGVQPAARVTDRLGLAALAYVISNRHREVPSVEIGAVLDNGPVLVDDARPHPHDLSTRNRVSDPAGLLAELARMHDPPRSGSTDPGDGSDGMHALIRDDRQRSRVSKLISRTISSLGEEHVALAAHLSTHVKTGYVCSYSAPPRVRWFL